MLLMIVGGIAGLLVGQAARAIGASPDSRAFLASLAGSLLATFVPKTKQFKSIKIGRK
jgi:hypothetical protein